MMPILSILCPNLTLRNIMKTIHRYPTFVAIGAILITGLQFVVAQDDLPYDSGSDGSDGIFQPPSSLPNRYRMATAYDPVRDRVVCNGGYDRGESGRRTAEWKAETWVFDRTEWTQLQPATFVPALSDAKMVWDPVRQEIVMFGGRTQPNNLVSDKTWTWDGTDWTEEAPATSPPARDIHHMIWDATNQNVLLFGGRLGNNVRLTDVWTWNGTTWTEVTTTNAPEANFNSNHGDMVWDTANARPFLYSELYLKTYTFDGATWSLLGSTNTPNTGQFTRMAYDEVRGEPVLYNNSQTWAYRTNEWVQLSPANPDASRNACGMVWHSGLQKIVLFGGNANNPLLQRTALWDGIDYEIVTQRNHTVDMSTKPDGIWNYTAITIPKWVDVYFSKNAANSPVVWLATLNVTINGRVFLNGQNGPPSDSSGSVAQGGPGGFNGGLGGVRKDVSGTNAGTPGQGPGGGSAPTDPSQHGEDATYGATYGNSLIQPLVGGSGGAGGSSSDTANGGTGGAGGGAILVASSRDIDIPTGGLIQARGGTRTWGGASYGGDGSGGAIKLVADRVQGGGSVDARAGDTNNNNRGRVRIEAFYRPFAPNALPVPSATAPVESFDFSSQPGLAVISVSGNNVAQPATGRLSSPDVMFTEAGSIDIVVQGTEVPVGTPVTLRITTNTGVIELPLVGDPDVTLNASGMATFSTIVPAGLGTIQAFAEFTLAP
jgi:hypothetical protein